MSRFFLVALFAFTMTAWAAPIRVVDDAGREVVLPAPAKRIVSLAPHVTESLFEAGAGGLIVGTVAFSDHPPAARALPRVGDHALLDLERIVELRPDLVVVWLEGNNERHIEKVRALGVPVYHDRPGTLEQIPSSLRRLGKLTGNDARAEAAAQAFESRKRELARRFTGRAPVDVFFQVWPKPLLTINGRHIISDVIRLCGGRNVFADARLLVPTLDAEAVLAANPQAVIRTGAAGDDDALALWRRLASFRPAATGALLMLPTDALSRHSPRILDGAELMCAALDDVRRKAAATR